MEETCVPWTSYQRVTARQRIFIDSKEASFICLAITHQHKEESLIHLEVEPTAERFFFLETRNPWPTDPEQEGKRRKGAQGLIVRQLSADEGFMMKRKIG